ncbi:MAG TPA: hypothetical protein VFT51_02610, partial [Bacillales bacterium]|nr:hypothetical protein [Bacillales bacterium]
MEKPLSYKGKNYQLTFAEDRPFVFLEDEKGNQLAELFALSSIHSLDGRDDTTKVGSWQVESTSDETVYTLRAESSVWEGKIYRFR